jgi:hypothetical protein
MVVESVYLTGVIAQDGIPAVASGRSAGHVPNGSIIRRKLTAHFPRSISEKHPMSKPHPFGSLPKSRVTRIWPRVAGGPAWRQRRWALWLFGTLFALVIAYYWIADEIYPFVSAA